MTSSMYCCVRNCTSSRSADKNVSFHSFPDPDKDEDRFRAWIHAIGGNILVMESQFVYRNRKVCIKHFEPKYHTRSSRLSANAVPTLDLKGLSRKRPLSDDTNVTTTNLTLAEPSTSAGPSRKRPLSDVTNVTTTNLTLAEPSTSAGTTAPEKTTNPKRTTLKVATATKKGLNTLELHGLLRKLQMEKNSYAARLKKALKLSENTTFQRCLRKFKTLAALFTVMQFREVSKAKMGRRFTRDEKIMALTLYKQGPKAYRWLSKIFVLPSPCTLSRLVSLAGLRPGINKKIFIQLKKRAERMNENEKLCLLLFDEMSITPHYEFNRKRDLITGFVNNGKQTKRNIATHALVFMLRGIVKNYKQPLVYTFCRGSTGAVDLKNLIKDIIVELQKCGLNVLATVCDQGAANVSAINKLIHETREHYIRTNRVFKNETFEINGEEIIPLYDPPHLIKGIRNNLLTKNLKCTIENKVKIAEWDHIMKLHEENPAYKGIKLVKNLTELHVDPKRIPKMKVKFATQIFSNTVASTMGYLADKEILPAKCKDTADVLLFFDNLFDSMNGSFENSKKRSGKHLLRPVTPKSQHCEVWANAKKVLKSMKFIDKDGREGTVPSLTNWLRTLENIEILKQKLFDVHKVKSIWMRHFNQDPLENFFGCIRSHGWRNISPTPSGFESAFASLLINNLSSNHSVGSNCEEDDCKIFQSMECLLKKENMQDPNLDIDWDDLNLEIINYSEKKNDKRISGQINYVAGYILKKGRHLYKKCKKCQELLYDKNCENEYLQVREYTKTKALAYPSENILVLFSAIQDVANYILEKKSDLPYIKNYIKTIMYSIIDFNFFDCPDHKTDVLEFFFELSSRFFLNNWCRDINNILNGTIVEYCKTNDEIKKLGLEYYNKRKKCR